MLSREHAAARAAKLDLAKAACDVMPAQIAELEGAHGGDTIYLTVIDAEGNIVSFIQSVYSAFGSGPGAAERQGSRCTIAARCSRIEPGQPNTLAPRKRPLHTIIPAFMEKDGTRIGFGIMGGWTQSQAHAQFVSNIVDYGMTIQQALEAGPVREELVPRMRRERRGARAGIDAQRAQVVRPRGPGGGAADGYVRAGPGGDERRGRAFRCLRAPTRWGGDTARREKKLAISEERAASG